MKNGRRIWIGHEGEIFAIVLSVCNPVSKVIVIGDGGSGKTSLAQRYCAGIFSSEYKKVSFQE